MGFPVASTNEKTPNSDYMLFGRVLQVTHARSGGNIEVMGLMQGKVMGDTMIVMDAFALPVEGTETRVSAQDQAYEYMVAYMEKIKEVCNKLRD
jgi:COP9 signalosome complex subunit 5